MQLSDFRPTVPTLVQQGDIATFNSLYEDLAKCILNETVPSAHRTAALRLLLESKMTLIHGITHPNE